MNSRLVSIPELSATEEAAMYSLLRTHFEGVKPDVFAADLNQKNWVVLLYEDNTDKLLGFSTLLMYQTEFANHKFSVVYSGDTIVDPSAWSSTALARNWIAAVKTLSHKYAEGKLYWLLISGGYRTYRFLPLFWQEFYPRYDAATPPTTAKLIEFLAQQQFGKYYDRTANIVRFPHPHVLRNRLRGIPTERLQDPHISFFQQQNPGHINGDELVCLTEISEANLTTAGKRMWFAKTDVQSALPDFKT